MSEGWKEAFTGHILAEILGFETFWCYGCYSRLFGDFLKIGYEKLEFETFL